MSELQINNKTVLKPKNSTWEKVRKDFKKNKWVYVMAIPMIVFFILFCYGPMYGILIAFQDYNPRQGIMGSTWVGLKHFKSYFNSMYFARTFKNTALISIESLLFGFPAAIILALMINELKNAKFKRVVQTVTYLPQFISLVVICGMVIDFTGTDGLLNAILSHFGVEATNWLTKPEWFRPIYIISGMWQSMGWDSIVYLSALSGIDPTLYEAATIDGAGRWKQLLHVTLPGIAPTIIVMLILNIGGLMSVGYSKIILLYNPMTYETADVISSYAYRRGILGKSYSFSTAVGLIESLIGFGLLLIANKLSKKYLKQVYGRGDKMVGKRSRGEKVFDTVNVILLSLLVVVCAYPLLYVVFASFSDPYKLMQHKGLLFKPLGFSLNGYKLVLSNPDIISGLLNTLLYVVVGTFISILLTSISAYVLSRKGLLFGKPLMLMVTITMFFSGGLIPFFLQVQKLGLENTRWAIVLPSAISVYNLIVLKSAYQSIPDSLIESAKIDGANDLTILFKIMMPVSKATLAVITLFYAVGYWNEWFNAMLFLRDRSKYPLQLILREILINNDTGEMMKHAASSARFVQADAYKGLIKYSTIVISTLPIICVYPFLQKYFVKGVMTGSLKE